MSDLGDEELVKRFEDLLWKVGNKIGERHNDGGFMAHLDTGFGPLNWMSFVGAFAGKPPLTGVSVHASVDCYDGSGVVFKKATVNGKLMEDPVYSYGMMRVYLPVLEQQVPLECLSEIPDD